MANLYLLGSTAGRNGLELAKTDADAKIVLVQDGVYLDASDLVRAGKKVYAIAGDVEKRGLKGRLSNVELIDYAKLVDLIVDDKVINFA